MNRILMGLAVGLGVLAGLFILVPLVSTLFDFCWNWWKEELR